MAAKADKDALKKNAFWYALGGFVVLWLIAVLCVSMAGDPKKKADYEAADKGIKAAASGPKNEHFFAPWDKYNETAMAHKDRVWEAGWKQQEKIYTWPPTMTSELVLRYPSDPFGATAIVDLDRRSKYRDQYVDQFYGLDTMLSPVEFKGGFDAVFPKQKFDSQKAPSREEIWIAQEDFWVRSQMMLILQEAMNSVALFKDVTEERLGKSPKLPDGVLGRRVFRSANWEVDLLVVKSAEGARWEISGDSTIKNVSRTQKLQPLASLANPNGLPFRFSQDATATEIVRIAGEPLAYDQSSKFGKNIVLTRVPLLQSFAKTNPKPLGLQQVMEWETSPIRRVDALEVPLHSHRTVTWGLKVNDALKNLDPDPVVEGADPTGGAGMMGGMMGGMGGGLPTGPGGVGGAAGVDATKTNAIRRPRYMHITKQCRHIPIALQAVVDQTHIHDVLGAVTNSPLRVQITQVAFHNVTTPTRGAAAAAGGTPGGVGGDMPMPMPMPMPRPMAMTPTPGRPFLGGGPGFRPGEETGSGVLRPPGEQAPQVVDTAKMVELTVYGVATLYERYPPAPPKADEPMK